MPGHALSLRKDGERLGVGLLLGYLAFSPRALCRYLWGAQAAVASGVPRGQVHKMGYKAHVLLAEDEAISRHLLKRILTSEGYRLTVVKDGLAALAAYEEHGADVLLVDWMMPGLDGLEVVRRVRALPTPVPPFIVMLTGRIERDDLVTGLDTGADDYITKPFDRRELLARIRGGVRNQQLMRELWRNNDLLHRMAMTDPLTGLPNRRAFDEWLVAERRWPDRSRPYGVVIADLNRMKGINDTHGHLAGDQALREVASRLQGALRLSDFVARYGGDEFVIGLPDCDMSAANTILGRLIEAVSATPLTLEDGTAVSLAVSAGIAVYPEDGKPEALLAIADRRLYEAKAAAAQQAA